MSRIESEKIHPEEVEVSLSDVLHDLKTIVSGQIYAKQPSLSSACPCAHRQSTVRWKRSPSWKA